MATVYFTPPPSWENRSDAQALLSLAENGFNEKWKGAILPFSPCLPGFKTRLGAKNQPLEPWAIDSETGSFDFATFSIENNRKMSRNHVFH